MKCFDGGNCGEGGFCNKCYLNNGNNMNNSASRTAKLAGLKSVRDMAKLVSYSEAHLYKIFNNDKEMFDALLARAIQINSGAK